MNPSARLEAIVLAHVLAAVSLAAHAADDPAAPAATAARAAALDAKKQRLKKLEDERAALAAEIAAETSAEPTAEPTAEPAAGAAPTAPTAAPEAGSAPAAPASGGQGRVGYLSTVIVSATRDRSTIGNLSTAVTVIDKKDVQELQRNTSLEEPLKFVPGVLVRDQLGGATRIGVSSRGSGATTTDGLRSMRLLIDGIPKNNAAGTAQDFVNIDMGSIESIEVVRGPSSALYGNQAGGILAITTEEGRKGQPFTAKQTFGSDGFLRTHLKAGGRIDGEGLGFSYFASAFHNASDGFRQQAAYRDTGFNAKVRMFLGDTADLTTVAAYNTITQQAPGALTRAEAEADPRKADPVATTLDGNRSKLDEFRFGMTYRQAVSTGNFELTGYYIPRQINYLYNDTRRTNQIFTNRGASGRYVHTERLFGLPNRFTVGLDYQNTPITTGNFGRAATPQAGTTFSELEEIASVVGPFILEELSLSEQVSVNVGARYDRITFKIDNLIRPNDGTFDLRYTHLSPKAGVVFKPMKALSLYANYGQGFEAPIVRELSNAPNTNGEFVANLQVKPFTVRSVEVGGRGQFGALSFDVALYQQKVDDLIVRQNFLRPPPLTGQFTASVNAGKASQKGLELGAAWRFGERLRLRGAYTYSDFVYDVYAIGTANFAGNHLPGVPKHHFAGDLSYRQPNGLNAALELQRVGWFYLNDANTARNDAYTVVNLRFGFEGIGVGMGLKLSPFIGLQNLLDKHYTSQAAINAAGGRYFFPLPGRNYFAGVKAEY